MEVKKLHELAVNTFGKRESLMSLWQEMAMNFYPERADFTYQRTLGTDFAANLMTSYPVIVRRDLGNQIGSMLRPTEKQWNYMVCSDERVMQDNDSRAWLEWATIVQRRAMYDRITQFTKATKQGDHDFATFGQCCISIELNRHATALLYRCWHLRDMAWLENSEGKICPIFRKWKPTARELVELFPKTVHQSVKQLADKAPFTEVDCMHMVFEADMVDGKWNGKPYVSIYYDVQNQTELEMVGIVDTIYVIPRWQTVSGSQYAFSPATVAALPDARLVQAMTYTLLEAGEKASNPPLIADQNIFRTDVALYAGGLTWADLEGDGKLSDYLHVLTNDKSGMPLGIEMQKDCRSMLEAAFFMNVLKPFNPATDPTMTAFQAGQIVQDYIRKALPLFEPMEMDYNGAVCEATFGLLFRSGTFGPIQNMPTMLSGKEIQFRFKSPLHDAIDQMKGQVFLQAKQLIAEAVAMDPTAAMIMDAKVALRDALSGIPTPAKWMHSEAEVQAVEQQQQDAQQTQAFLAAAQGGANVAKTISESQANLAKAQPAPNAGVPAAV